MKNKSTVKDLARQRIRWLFKLAYNETKKGNYERSRRYTKLIIRIAEKGGIKVPRRIKRSICKNCGIVLIPGLTARVRVRSEGSRGSHVTVTCLVCGWMKRYYIKVSKREESKGVNKGGKT